MSHQHLLALAPLYALDALDGTELRDFETHVTRCEPCLDEVAQYQDVAAALSTAEEVPSHVWDRIVDQIESHDTPVGHTAEVIEFDPAIPRRRIAMTRILGVAAAGVLVAASVFVGREIAVNDQSTAQGLTAAAEQAATLTDSFDGEFLVDGSPVARVVLTQEGQGYLIPTEALEPLERDLTYQLWVITSDELVISGGVLGYDPGPSSFTWSGEVNGFALTREVAGGVVVSEGDVVSVVTEA